jgi:hypothetical protein
VSLPSCCFVMARADHQHHKHNTNTPEAGAGHCPSFSVVTIRDQSDFALPGNRQGRIIRRATIIGPAMTSLSSQTTTSSASSFAWISIVSLIVWSVVIGVRNFKIFLRFQVFTIQISATVLEKQFYTTTSNGSAALLPSIHPPTFKRLGRCKRNEVWRGCGYQTR